MKNLKLFKKLNIVQVCDALFFISDNVLSNSTADCGFPPEYCKYSKRFAQCQPWLKIHHPELYPELLETETQQAGEGGGASAAAADGAEAPPEASQEDEGEEKEEGNEEEEEEEPAAEEEKKTKEAASSQPPAAAQGEKKAEKKPKEPV